MKYGLPASLHCKRAPAASSWPPAFLPPGFHTISQSPSLGPLNHPLLYLQIGLESGLESIKLVEDFHGCRLAKETLPVHAIYPGHEARILTCFQGQLLPTAANRSGLPEMCGSSSHFWIPCRRNISLFQTCSLSGELKGGQLRTFQE